MSTTRPLLVAGRLARWSLGGLLVGALVLGVGGRLLMRAIAVLNGTTPGFSIGGTLEVLAAGAMYGAAGGAALALLPRRLGRWRSPVGTAALYVFVLLTSDAARSAAGGLSTDARTASLIAFGLLLLLFSIITVALMDGIEPSGEQPASGMHEPP